MYSLWHEFRDGIAFITVTGEFSFEEFAAGWSKVFSSPSFRPGMPIIIDCERVTRRSSGLEDARRTVKFIYDGIGPQTVPWPLVWVASEPGFDAYIKLLKMLALEYGNAAGLPRFGAVPGHFHTMEEARTWVKEFLPPATNSVS